MIRFAAVALSLLVLTGCPEDAPPTPTPTPTLALEECIDPNEADVLQYLPIEDCVASLVGCDAGGEYFEDACGCGCLIEDPIDDCIDPDEADVLQYQPIEDCIAGLVGCDAGGEYFEDACGCGCLLE